MVCIHYLFNWLISNRKTLILRVDAFLMFNNWFCLCVYSQTSPSVSFFKYQNKEGLPDDLFLLLGLRPEQQQQQQKLLNNDSDIISVGSIKNSLI